MLGNPLGVWNHQKVKNPCSNGCWQHNLSMLDTTSQLRYLGIKIQPQGLVQTHCTTLEEGLQNLRLHHWSLSSECLYAGITLCPNFNTGLFCKLPEEGLCTDWMCKCAITLGCASGFGLGLPQVTIIPILREMDVRAGSDITYVRAVIGTKLEDEMVRSCNVVKFQFPPVNGFQCTRITKCRHTYVTDCLTPPFALCARANNLCKLCMKPWAMITMRRNYKDGKSFLSVREDTASHLRTENTVRTNIEVLKSTQEEIYKGSCSIIFMQRNVDTRPCR